MSKWLDAARDAAPNLIPDSNIAVPCSVSSDSSDRFSGEQTKSAVFRLTELSELLEHGNESRNTGPESAENVVCFLCSQPVERGTSGTGALNGDDLHMDCYWKRYPKGHHRVDGA